MFKLTSLNLNGIRSATTKGVERWIEATRPDCICVQEVKAQAADVATRFEQLAGMQGHFHFAQKKGYSGVGIYTRHEPSDIITGYGSPEFSPGFIQALTEAGVQLHVFDHQPRVLGLLDADADTILNAMAKEPILIERPLVRTEKGVRLCRPQDVVREIL